MGIRVDGGGDVISAGDGSWEGRGIQINTTGVITATSFVGTTADFSGAVSIGGTLTYEDVTNIDSVGLITARAGVVVGSGITLSKDGDGFYVGVVTATSFKGDGSGLTGVSAGGLSTDTSRNTWGGPSAGNDGTWSGATDNTLLGYDAGK